MDYAFKQLEERYESLPSDIRAAIDSVDVSNTIAELGQKYKLHIDKTDEFSDETGLVMLGLTHPKDYLANLKKRLELPDDMARMIVADINEQVFKPIRESLKRIHNISQERNVVDDVAQNVYHVAPEINSNPRDATSYKLQERGGQAYHESNIGASGLDKAEEKILADSGINIEKSPAEATPHFVEAAPPKKELIEALEDPGKIQKETVTVPAGFTLTKTAPAGSVPVASPDQKLSAPTRLPPTESVYEEKGLPAEAMPQQKQVDPYREPV